MANVTTVTFDYILVIVFLFPLNVGVSLCFHCTVLVPVCMFLKKVEYQELGDEKRRGGGGANTPFRTIQTRNTISILAETQHAITV